MEQRSRVPKFGDWENEKTAIHDFHQAREDKIGGKTINPNDPQQNPRVKAGVRSSGVASLSWDRKPSESNDKVPPRTPERSRMRPPEKVAAIQKFGEWDEIDPDSATGYTTIFNKVREEKQTGVANVMTMPSSPNGRNQAGSKRRRILCAFDSLRRIRIRKSGGGMSKPNDLDMSSSKCYDDNASIRSEWDEGNPYGESTSGNIIHSDTVWREDGLENKSCSSESPDQPGIVNNKKRRWLSWWWHKK